MPLALPTCPWPAEPCMDTEFEAKGSRQTLASGRARETWEDLLPKFWRLLRSSCLPTCAGSAYASTASGNVSLLTPLSDVDLLHIVAREIRGPSNEVVRVAALAAHTGFAWYSQYRSGLQILVQTLSAAPPAQAPNIAEAVRQLAEARLCMASTAGAVAKVLVSAAHPEEAAASAIELLAGFQNACPGQWLNFMSAVPILLQGACENADVGHGEDQSRHGNVKGLAKELAHLIADGALDPTSPATGGGDLALSVLWQNMTRLSTETQRVALRLLRITALHVVTLSGNDQVTAKPQQCTEQEVKDILILAQRLPLACAYSLCELGDAGIMRMDWGAILTLLVGLQGNRREVALRSAIWLNAEAPTWLRWTDMLAHVEALEDAGSRHEVMDLLADLLRSGKDPEWRTGKDEDYAVGVSPRFERWVRWLVQVAHCPKWLCIVKKLFCRLQQSDPSGKSCLVKRLSCAHSFPCAWAAPKESGCACYCEFATEHVIPLLFSICDDPSPELADTVAAYIRWRRGPQLSRAVKWITDDAMKRPDASVLRKATVLCDLLCCYKLFEGETGLKALEGVPLDTAAIAAQAVCNPCRRLPTSIALQVFAHLTSSYAAGARHTRKDASEFASACSGLLAFMPKAIWHSPWVSGLLRSCCLRWGLSGKSAACISAWLRKAFQQSLTIRRVCHEPPPLLALADMSCNRPGMDNSLALLVVAY